MSVLSFKKNPRPGQADVFEAAENPSQNQLVIQLPTGYGKTFTAAGVYSIRKKLGLADRLLYIVATSKQLDQFVKDARSDFQDANCDGCLTPVDIAYQGPMALAQHKKNTHQIFACSIQALTSKVVASIIPALQADPKYKWMVVVDECHHYADDKTWGEAVKKLRKEFELAMSATPYRPKNDGIYREPDIVVTYKEAVKQEAVKPMVLHAYNYVLETVDGESVIKHTIESVYEKAGTSPNASDASKKINRFLAHERMTSKYVSPLIEIPIERLLQERLRTGFKLQAIAGAMSCLHAKFVYECIKGYCSALEHPLTVDWVGSGPDGRTEKENKEVLDRFCPAKDSRTGKRPTPALDILVHVGMAGEGLDSINVSEIIHLNACGINNGNLQEDGRGARYLPGVTCYINVDHTSPKAKFLGSSVQELFDNPELNAPDPNDIKDEDKKRTWLPNPLPEWENIQPRPICFEGVDSGTVLEYAKVVVKKQGYDKELLKNPDFIKDVEEMVCSIHRSKMDAENSKESLESMDMAVESALGIVARAARNALYGDSKVPASVAGDIRKNINARKKFECGRKEKDMPTLKLHYDWLKNLENEIRNGEAPDWLL